MNDLHKLADLCKGKHIYIETHNIADNSIESNQCMGTPIQQMEDTALMQALEHLTARERYILFERVLGERNIRNCPGRWACGITAPLPRTAESSKSYGRNWEAVNREFQKFVVTGQRWQRISGS